MNLFDKDNYLWPMVRRRVISPRFILHDSLKVSNLDCMLSRAPGFFYFLTKT